MAKRPNQKNTEIRKDLMSEAEAKKALAAFMLGLGALELNLSEDREALTRLIEGASEVEAALEISFMPVGIWAGVEFTPDAE